MQAQRGSRPSRGAVDGLIIPTLHEEEQRVHKCHKSKTRSEEEVMRISPEDDIGK